MMKNLNQNHNHMQLSQNHMKLIREKLVGLRIELLSIEKRQLKIINNINEQIIFLSKKRGSYHSMLDRLSIIF